MNVPSALNDRHQELFYLLRRRISLLEYPPGFRLSEAEIAEEFSLSRTPVRRVIAELQSQGLVSSVHGVGTMVTEFDGAQLQQIWQLRLQLVSTVLALGVTPVDGAIKAKFQALLGQAKAVLGQADQRRFAELNIAFYEAMATLCANQPLRKMLDALFYQSHRLWLHGLSGSLEAESLAFFHDIQAIERRVAEGDGRTALMLWQAAISAVIARHKLA